MASTIMTFIYEYTVGMVTDWLKQKADEQVKEKAATDDSAFDYVKEDLARLEEAVDDYDRAYTAARLAAHGLEGGEASAHKTLRGCTDVQRTPEISRVKETLKELRKLDKHSERVIAATIMRAEAEVQIHEEAVGRHLQDRDRLKESTNPPRPFDKEGTRFLAGKAQNKAVGRAKMAGQARDEATEVTTSAANIEDRISTLMGQLQYLKESMERDSGMFIALDEGICKQYRLHAERAR